MATAVCSDLYMRASFLILQRLGIALGLSARAQINVKLERVDFLKYFRSVPELVFPVFWQDVVSNSS